MSLRTTILVISFFFALHAIKLPEGKDEMKPKENMQN